MERITDYPGHSLSQSPSSMRRISLSVSEGSLTGSLTSEGSLSFDGSRKPRKRILKMAHGPRKNSTNRVRWNIPGEAGDSMSLESFESTSTTSSVLYQKARNSVSESRRNWQEFEEQPPPGSTGLTPSKPSLSALTERSVGRECADNLSPSSLSPCARSSAEFERSVSPLQHSTCMPASVTDQHTSTPIASTARQECLYKDVNDTDVDSTHSPTHLPVAPPTSVPLLILDHSNLSELEASTVEDRVRSHLFQIPNGPSTKKISSPPAYSGYVPPESLAHLCGGSDADDYDHLSPQSNPGHTGPSLAPAESRTTRFDFFPPPSRTRKRSKPRLSSPPPPPRVVENETSNEYRDSDIDEALSELKDPARRVQSVSSVPKTAISHISNPSSLGRPSVSERDEKRRDHRERGADTSLDHGQQGGGGLRTRSREQQNVNTQQIRPHPSIPLHPREMRQQTTSSRYEREEDAPPPVPPKLRRQTSGSPPMRISDKARSSLSPSSTCSPAATSEGNGGESHTQDLHRFPPSSATSLAQVVEHRNLSQEEAHEDAMSSISNATLVPEPGECSPHNVHSASNTPKLRAKFDQMNGMQNSVSTHTAPPSTWPHPSTHIHPETFPFLPSSSALTHQSWKDGGSTSTTHFAPHPPPLPYHHVPQSYHRESQLPPIEEKCPPETQAIITVSNSGSDSSLRGASPPDKISHASVIQTHMYGRNHYHGDGDRIIPSLTQRVRPMSAQTHSSNIPPSRGQIFAGGSNQTYPQAPRSQNPPVEGGMMSRNHRLYHSQRSALSHAPRPWKRRLSGSKEASHGIFPRGAKPPLPGNYNSRVMLKFVPVNSFESPLEEIRNQRPRSPPYHAKALSQDDQLMGAAFYPGRVGTGRGLGSESNYYNTDRAIQRSLLDVGSSGRRMEGGGPALRKSYGKRSNPVMYVRACLPRRGKEKGEREEGDGEGEKRGERGRRWRGREKGRERSMILYTHCFQMTVYTHTHTHTHTLLLCVCIHQFVYWMTTGHCVVCQQVIASGLRIERGSRYHTACFKCAICGEWRGVSVCEGDRGQ